MRIGVIGGGVVGRATARAYLEYVDEVRVYDIIKERRTHDLAEVMACNLIFLCLPTPQETQGLECNLSALTQFFENPTVGFQADLKQASLVLRSTVPIGTTRRLAEKYHLLNLVHSPEFLTARCAEVDAQLPARNIIGEPSMKRMSFVPADMPVITPRPWTNCGTALAELYSKRFPSVPVHFMTPDESEAVKLFVNGFFSVKVAFFNEINQICEKMGMDWERVLSGVLSDGRIAHSHTKVPGPDGKYGFGGTCLPKDLANLFTCSVKAGLMPSIVSAAMLRNTNDRRRS